jgi:hypothetical protein
LAVIKLTTVQVTKVPLYNKIRETGVICFAMPGLTEGFYITQRKKKIDNML